METRQARILVLEYEMWAAEATGYILEGQGYDVTCFDDGDKGLQAATTGQYDLCVLNCIFPTMDAFSFARKLKDRGVYLPLLFVTSVPERKVRERALSTGLMVGYLSKPYSVEILIGRVAEALACPRPSSDVPAHVEADNGQTKAPKSLAELQRIQRLAENLNRRAKTETPSYQILENDDSARRNSKQIETTLPDTPNPGTTPNGKWRLLGFLVVLVALTTLRLGCIVVVPSEDISVDENLSISGPVEQLRETIHGDRFWRRQIALINNTVAKLERAPVQRTHVDSIVADAEKSASESVRDVFESVYEACPELRPTQQERFAAALELRADQIRAQENEKRLCRAEQERITQLRQIERRIQEEKLAGGD